jgi:glycosyltransferase involved in cell wall biosynthesis
MTLSVDSKKLRVLLIIEQCNPEWASVPLVGYRFYEELSKRVDVTLVTHARNQKALEKAHPNEDITYIAESKLTKLYYKVAERLSTIKGRIIWPLYNTLIYPVYGEFNQAVYNLVKPSISSDKYDIVHSITPMMPRYPVKVVELCQNTPFIIGPVNGGIPFPAGFQKVARQEFSYLNFLRAIGRALIPGYRMTYEKADRVLDGSTYTLDLLKQLFNLDAQHLGLFHENGIERSFLRSVQESGETDAVQNAHQDSHQAVNLLFVGRLVPYKGADLLLEALMRLPAATQQKVTLTLVGDGPERSALEQQAQPLGDRVQFAGWVTQSETLSYYQAADIFCANLAGRWCWRRWGAACPVLWSIMAALANM